jgi:tRNA dimethylallyltransferase
LAGTERGRDIAVPFPVAIGATAPMHVICGPTGAGKSALAFALADALAARGVTSWIVSADSRQVYRRFDIGTAKPSPDERRRVHHEGIDVVDPTVRYSAADWAVAAEGWIASAHAARAVPLIVGGTGLYLRALVEPFFEAPPLDVERRARLDAFLRDMDTAELRRWCEALDAPRAHLGRTQLLRAVETALLAGARMSELHERNARVARVEARYLVVDPGASLRDALARRTDAMLAAGWMDEVQQLMHEVPAEAPAWKATGYRTLREVAEGRMSLAAGRERVAIETRQYAKRQRTWFRHQLEPSLVTRVDPAAGDALAVAERWWRETRREGRGEGDDV